MQALRGILDSECATAVSDRQLSDLVGVFRAEKLVQGSESFVDLHLARNVIPTRHSAAMVATPSPMHLIASAVCRVFSELV